MNKREFPIVYIIAVINH